ncbi:hypothetical protein SDC9_205770 [bioreactor metagenome]|uniref:Uncharacterized protein n=1 Tax=bioreactor metagenome TaxID=1076179 RepID=A0A645J4L7_9ZZZZ
MPEFEYFSLVAKERGYKLPVSGGSKIPELFIHLMNIRLFAPSIGIQELHRIVDRHLYFVLSHHRIDNLASLKIRRVSAQERHALPG